MRRGFVTLTYSFNALVVECVASVCGLPVAVVAVAVYWSVCVVCLLSLRVCCDSC